MRCHEQAFMYSTRFMTFTHEPCSTLMTKLLIQAHDSKPLMNIYNVCVVHHIPPYKFMLMTVHNHMMAIMTIGLFKPDIL